MALVLMSSSCKFLITLPGSDGGAVQTLSTTVNELLCWDVDMVRLPLLVGCLEALSPHWTLAANGPPKTVGEDCPRGLVLAAWPFWIILTVGNSLHNTSPEDRAQLVAISHGFIPILRHIFDTNNPKVLEPAHDHSWLTISNVPARVTGTQLDAALKSLSYTFDFQLWAYSYGMKYPVLAFWPILEKCFDAMSANWGQEASQLCRSETVLDLAAEMLTHGGVVLSRPSAHLQSMHLRWPGFSTNAYPLFAGLGMGFGGVTCCTPPLEQCPLIQVCVYPPWKHCLMAIHKPALLAARQARQQFFYRAQGPLGGVLRGLEGWNDVKGGLRFEVRAKVQGGMEQQLLFLGRCIDSFFVHIETLEVSVHDILQEARIAYNKSQEVGLFEVQGGLQSIAPSWKRLCYHRLLAALGYSHKFWNRWAYRQAADNAPWRVVGVGGGVGPFELQAGYAQIPAQPADGEERSISRPEHLPGAIGSPSLDNLNGEELEVLSQLPTKRARGGGFCIYYKPPWGSGTPQSRTLSYQSKAGLARALWLWAGPQWVHRVKI